MDDGEKTKLLTSLWKATPDNLKGKLPKPLKKDAEKGKCKECDGWHGLPAIHLDYLGHADTCRLIAEVDPFWQWEPMAGWTPTGEPVFVRDRSNNPIALWIKLTILGVTRPGVGTVAPKYDAEKELIGDAIRNAAMRFGVGADMWSKASHVDEEGDKPPDRTQEPPPDPATWFERNGWADKAEHDEWRAETVGSLKVSTDELKAAVKDWSTANGLDLGRAVPKGLADALDTFLDQWATGPATTPPEAPEKAQGGQTGNLQFPEGEEPF